MMATRLSPMSTVTEGGEKRDSRLDCRFDTTNLSGEPATRAIRPARPRSRSLGENACRSGAAGQLFLGSYVTEAEDESDKAGRCKRH